MRAVVILDKKICVRLAAEPTKTMHRRLLIAFTIALCVKIVDPLIGTLQGAWSMMHGKIFDGLQGQSGGAVAAT